MQDTPRIGRSVHSCQMLHRSCSRQLMSYKYEGMDSVERGLGLLYSFPPRRKPTKGVGCVVVRDKANSCFCTGLNMAGQAMFIVDVIVPALSRMGMS